ncbi:hypothetical protein H7J77_06940 [Mycolicibacillus parakoreensis]|uniref:Transmembrane protein n=1 Tax=Mycolicibacillus parakoreensis TaxID=1069221 RepID=A0ABY3U7A4_9MYCO|nr:hypothetical protein [Mycolicibacillus parakoreensis]MCV7315274.1 hypothetical protein [Mycolicibacillus parakoreensis]ULN53397.1 hypothetical protein MIU77_03345 [Mycolicibacillus parakoreensis]
MPRPQPGWSVAVCAVLVFASSWLPWLHSPDGRANAVGGVVGALPRTDGFGAGQLILWLAAVLLVTGAMIGRGISPLASSVGALTVSLLLVATVTWYYRDNVTASIAAGYGLFTGAAGVAAATACSVWALLAALRER